jgi:hypothetical protein
MPSSFPVWRMTFLVRSVLEKERIELLLSTTMSSSSSCSPPYFFDSVRVSLFVPWRSSPTSTERVASCSFP